MLTLYANCRVTLVERVATQGPLGETVTFKPVSKHHAAIIPLDVKAVSQYMQLNTVASHKVLLRGNVVVTMGTHEILHQTTRYKPTASAKHHDQVTEVIANEV